MYDHSKVTRGELGAQVALFWISIDSEERLSVKSETLKLSLYVALISADGIEQEGLVLLSLLFLTYLTYLEMEVKDHVFQISDNYRKVKVV